MTERPKALKVRPEGIPTAIKAMPNWALWSYKYNAKLEKWDKPPYQGASSTNPGTWRTFDEAYELYVAFQLDGLYFALPDDRSMNGGDFDHCLIGTTIKDAHVAAWVRSQNTYTEISPGGEGLRTVGYGSKPGEECRKGTEIELYDHGRFLSITGHHYEGTPETVNDNADAIESLYEEVFGAAKVKKENSSTPLLTPRKLTRGDKLLLLMARKESKFKQLFNTDHTTIKYKDKEAGETKTKIYTSPSEADAALFCKMAYWTNGDPVRALRIVLTSERLRGKWDSGRGSDSWVEQEIARACELLEDGFLDADVIDYLEMGSRGLVVSPDLVAKKILKDFRFLTPKDTREIHVFDEWIYESDDGKRRIGIYKDHGVVLIDAEARKLLKHRFSTSNIKEITAIIRAETYCDRDVFDSAPLNLIPLHNGVFDLASDALIDYSPEVPFFFIHAGGYYPTLLDKETAARKCIENVLPEYVGDGDELADPDPHVTKTVTDATVFQEIGGSCFYRVFLYRTALMLFGPKRSGKSILLAILRNAVGKDARSARTLQELTGNRFAIASLYHKTLNAAADIGSLGIENIGKFNELTGSIDTQTCERKGVDGFEFESYATLVFSTNDLPTLSPKAQKAEKEAFYDRWVLIETTRDFVKEPDPKIPNQIKDAGDILGEVLKEQENLDWATTWFVDGLRRVLKNKGYSEGDSSYNVKERWVSNTDSLAAYAAQRLEHTPGFHTHGKVFTEDYRAFCVENEMVEASAEMIGRRLPYLIPGTEKYDSTKYLGSVRWWRNLSIKGKSPIRIKETDGLKELNEPLEKGESSLREFDDE